MKRVHLIVIIIAVVAVGAIAAILYRSWSPGTETIDLGPMPKARLNRFLALATYLEQRYGCTVTSTFAIDYDDNEMAYDLIIAPLEALPPHPDQWYTLTDLLYEDGLLLTGLSELDPEAPLPAQYSSSEILSKVGIQSLPAITDSDARFVSGTCAAGTFEFFSTFDPLFLESEDAAPYGITEMGRCLRAMDMLDNTAIAEADHILIFEHLVADLDLGPGAEVLIVHGRYTSSIWKWLITEARMPLLLLAALIALVIWHFYPRFGPLIPDPERGIRELREHFLASARFLIRARLTTDLVKPARQPIIDALRRRCNRPNAGIADIVHIGAELAQLPHDEVQHALFSEDIKPGTLARTAAVLQQLRKSL